MFNISLRECESEKKLILAHFPKEFNIVQSQSGVRTHTPLVYGPDIDDDNEFTVNKSCR